MQYPELGDGQESAQAGEAYGGRATHLVRVWLMFCFSGTSSTVPPRMCFSEYCTHPLQIMGNGAHRTGVC